MRSGALDRLIYIIQKSSGFATDDNGVVREGTKLSIPMRAELLNATASDQTHDSGRTTDKVLKFGLRFLANVKVGDALHYEQSAYEILNVKEIGRRKGLELEAKETGPL